MARSTRESILTTAAELMRRKGYAAVGMKDVVASTDKLVEDDDAAIAAYIHTLPPIPGAPKHKTC